MTPNLHVKIVIGAALLAVAWSGLASGPANAAPQVRAPAACKIVNEPPSVPCGKFYNRVRVCPGLGTRKVIERRQNIC